MSSHVRTQVLIVDLHFEIAFENGKVDDEWVTFALDNVICENLVGAWVIQSAIVVSRR